MIDARVSPAILIRGAGEMASAIAWRLYMANLRRLVMTDLRSPMCVRRTVAFCGALTDGVARVEGLEAVAAFDRATIAAAWAGGRIPVVAADTWADLEGMAIDVVIDAVLAKRNLGTSIHDAGLVVALGPGFVAGIDCHLVIETNRGHDLGRIITSGAAQADTGIPGEIGGFAAERVLRAPRAGVFFSQFAIGDAVRAGEVIGRVDDQPVSSIVEGILRGLIRSGTRVEAGLKIGDVDPRGRRDHCWTISDKARAIGGAVLEAVMRRANRAESTA